MYRLIFGVVLRNHQWTVEELMALLAKGSKSVPWLAPPYAGALKILEHVVMRGLAAQVLGTDTWLEGGLSGSQRSGGLTEAQISDELGPDLERFPIPRNASATISWWQLRQAAFNRAVQVAHYFNLLTSFFSFRLSLRDRAPYLTMQRGCH